MKASMATLFISTAVTVHAGSLAQVMTKVARPLQQTMAVVVCAAACLVGFNPEVKANMKLRELSAGGGAGHGFFSGKMGVYAPGDDRRTRQCP